jgi:hypothetical protein
MTNTVIKIDLKKGDTSGINSVLSDLNRLGSGIDNISSKFNAFKNLTIIALVGEGIKKAGEAAINAANQFGEVQRTMIQLHTALGGNEVSFSRMTSLIDDMASKTLSSKDEVEKLVAELASLGKSDSDITKITQASIALSNVTGQDLNSAFTQLNATYTGSAGKLEKLIPQLGSLTKAQLENGGAIDLVNRKFTDISNNMAGGYSQSVNNLKKAFDDLNEGIGEEVSKFLQPSVEWITKIIRNWNDAREAKKKYDEAVANGDSKGTRIGQIDTVEIPQVQKQINDLLKNESYQATRLKHFQEIGGNTNDVQKIIDDIQVTKQKLYSQLVSLQAEKSRLEKTKESESPTRTTTPNVIKDEGTKTLPITEGYINATWDLVKAQRILASGLTEEEYNLQQYYNNGGGNLSDQGGASSETNYTSVESNQSLLSTFTDFFSSIKDSFNKSEAGSMTSSNSGFELLNNILGSTVSNFGSLFMSLSSVQSILNPISTILSAAMTVLQPVVNKILQPLVGMLNILGQTLGQILVPIIETILIPVMSFLSDAFIMLYNYGVMPLANGLIWAFNLIYNGIAGIYNGIAAAVNTLLGWAGVHMDYMAYRDLTEGFLKKIDKASLMGASGDDNSTINNGNTASYTGPTVNNFYINIEQNGVYVGVDQFLASNASGIKEAIKELDYQPT